MISTQMNCEKFQLKVWDFYCAKVSFLYTSFSRLLMQSVTEIDPISTYISRITIWHTKFRITFIIFIAECVIIIYCILNTCLWIIINLFLDNPFCIASLDLTALCFFFTMHINIYIFTTDYSWTDVLWTILKQTNFFG